MNVLAAETVVVAAPLFRIPADSARNPFAGSATRSPITVFNSPPLVFVRRVRRIPPPFKMEPEACSNAPTVMFEFTVKTAPVLFSVTTADRSNAVELFRINAPASTFTSPVKVFTPDNASDPVPTFVKAPNPEILPLKLVALPSPTVRR